MADNDQKIIDLDKIYAWQREFAREREWEQFHTPKNLAMALAVEASEVVELFQWLKDDEAKALSKNPPQKERVADELADVFYYLARLADTMDIDLNRAIWVKFAKNAAKYPVEQARGNAKKYTEF